MSDENTPPVLSDVNSIAYNGNLRDQLRVLHEMLGVEVTDVATGAMEYGGKFTTDAENLLKYFSKVASNLSLALVSTKEKKGKLTAEEQKDYENISSLVAVIGNVQDKLNRVIKTSKKATEVNNQLSEEGMSLAEYIMDAQQQFRNVRSSINAYGFLSNNPELARLFAEQNDKEGKNIS